MEIFVLYLFLALCIAESIAGLLGVIQGIMRIVVGRKILDYLSVLYYTVVLFVFSYISFKIAIALFNN